MSAVQLVCEVKFIRHLTPTVFELGFEADRDFSFEAGQFISVIVPGAGPHGRDLRRAYSIGSPPEKRPIELCIKLVDDGPGSQYLYRLKPGEKFRGMAPYGDFVYQRRPNRHAFFIATGTGIAPFRSMLFSKAFQEWKPLSTTCILGVSDSNELLYSKDFSDARDINWIEAVSRPRGEWSGFKGRVTDYLRSIAEEYPWLDTDYYLCGNGSMIEEVTRILTERGVAKDSILREIYYKPPVKKERGT